MPPTVLLAEDEERMRSLLALYFKGEGFTVIEAADGHQAIDQFRNNRVDLVVLDIMMPGLDGWQICAELRHDSNVPIIFLTARGEEQDKIFGFELGADDYITKPFSPRLLVARAKALLKRFGKLAASSGSRRFEMADLVVDDWAHEVAVAGQEMAMTPKEYELLLFLIENKGRALSREQILCNVWGADYDGDLHTVDNQVWRLREKLKPSQVQISTVRGIGYRLEG